MGSKIKGQLKLTWAIYSILDNFINFEQGKEKYINVFLFKLARANLCPYEFFTSHASFPPWELSFANKKVFDEKEKKNETNQVKVSVLPS